jgi:nucleoside-diphosphate-sugar epimerase
LIPRWNDGHEHADSDYRGSGLQQLFFVAEIRKARSEFGWVPKIGVREGVAQLAAWVQDNRELFA